eukprot:749286-Hanusia_phi.AAC.2
MESFLCSSRISSSHIADKVMSTYDDDEDCSRERKGSVHGADIFLMTSMQTHHSLQTWTKTI